MDIFRAFILGILQGVTEFLPISSSAHLILVPWWLGWGDPPLVYDVFVHLGTTVAVIVYFFRDWVALLRGGWIALRERQWNPEARMLFLLVIATIPAAILGLLLEEYMEGAMSDPAVVAATLLMTAALLFFTEYWSHTHAHKALSEMDSTDATIIGVAQAIAIIPGISRSGSTIAAGLLRRFNRVDATRFSFLMATPIILGGGAKAALNILLGQEQVDAELSQALIVGFFTAMISGYFCIAFLLDYVRKHRLTVFAWYCVIFGTISFIAALVRG